MKKNFFKWLTLVGLLFSVIPVHALDNLESESSYISTEYADELDFLSEDEAEMTHILQNLEEMEREEESELSEEPYQDEEEEQETSTEEEVVQEEELLIQPQMAPIAAGATESDRANALSAHADTLLATGATVQVSTWVEFRNAWVNQQVQAIELMNNITSPGGSTAANSLAATTRTEPIAIIGNGHTLQLMSATQQMHISNNATATQPSVHIRNLVMHTNQTAGAAGMIRAASAGVNNAQGWFLFFENVQTTANNIGSMTNAGGATAYVRNTGVATMNFMRGATGAAEAFFDTRVLIMSGGNSSASQINSTITGSFWQRNGTNFHVVFRDRLGLNIQHNNNTNTFVVDNTGARGIFEVLGDPTLTTHEGNTNVQIRAVSTLGAASGGVFSFDFGAGNTAGGLDFHIRDFATIDVRSTSVESTPVFMAQGRNIHFHMNNHARFEGETRGSPTDISASFRYRESGASSFNLDNHSTFHVIRRGGGSGNNSRAPVWRALGPNNHIRVFNGSRMLLENHNSVGGRQNAPTGNVGNRNNVVVDFSDNNTSTLAQQSSFTVEGEDSEIRLVSRYGAIMGSQGPINVNVGEGSIFTAQGNTVGNNRNAGLFNTTTGPIRFEMTSPQFYDFRNNTNGNSGSNLIAPPDSGAADASFFQSNNSMVEFWLRGANLNNEATFSHYGLTTYGTQGRNLNFNAGRSPGHAGGLLNQWISPAGGTAVANGMNRFNRVAANNNPIEVEWLNPPLDSDFGVYLRATVREGFNYMGDRIVRPLRDNEGWVLLEFTLPDGGSFTQLGHSRATMNVFGQSFDGVIYVPFANSDLFADEEDRLMPAGTQVRVVNAWRGGRENVAFPVAEEDLEALGTRTVANITPPQTVVLSGELTNATNTIRGTTEPYAHVFVRHDNAWHANSAQANSDGEFELLLAGHLGIGTVDVFAKNHPDLTFLTQVVNELEALGLSAPSTWTEDASEVFGNLQAAYGVDFRFHDASFPNALRAGVRDVRPALNAVKSVVVDSGYPEVTVGDTLVYTIVASNMNESAAWRDITLTDTLDTGLTFNDATRVWVNGSLLPREQIDFNDETRVLTIRTAATIQGLGDLTIAFEAIVNNNALDREIRNIATVSGTSDEEETIHSEDLRVFSIETNEAVNPYGNVQHPRGDLTLVTVPSIDFGTRTFSLLTQGEIHRGELSTDLDIEDTRSVNHHTSWTISLMKTVPLTNQTTSETLPHALRFRDRASDALGLLSVGVPQQLHVDTDDYVAMPIGRRYRPSDRWTAEDNTGFFLEEIGLEQGGDFRAELTWVLTATPSE